MMYIGYISAMISAFLLIVPYFHIYTIILIPIAIVVSYSIGTFHNNYQKDTDTLLLNEALINAIADRVIQKQRERENEGNHVR